MLAIFEALATHAARKEAQNEGQEISGKTTEPA